MLSISISKTTTTTFNDGHIHCRLFEDVMSAKCLQNLYNYYMAHGIDLPWNMFYLLHINCKLQNIRLILWRYTFTQLSTLRYLSEVLSELSCTRYADCFMINKKKINCKYLSSKFPNISHTSNGIANNGLINLLSTNGFLWFGRMTLS